MDAERNWTGFIVDAPQAEDGKKAHRLKILRRWKAEEPDMWWWDCKDCTESSGVFSVVDLEKLDAKGLISPPEEDDTGTLNTKHPREGHHTDYFYD